MASFTPPPYRPGEPFVNREGDATGRPIVAGVQRGNSASTLQLSEDEARILCGLLVAEGFAPELSTEFSLRVEGYKHDPTKRRNYFVSWSHPFTAHQAIETLNRERARIGQESVEWQPHITAADLFSRQVTGWRHTESDASQDEIHEQRRAEFVSAHPAPEDKLTAAVALLEGAGHDEAAAILRGKA